MKKLSLFLALVFVFLMMPLQAFAAESSGPLPVSAGIEALRGQFEAGVAPGEEGERLDYRYYSPAGENDTTKYPLVIFLHGIGHGDYEGSQLDDSDMPYWSSAELQARFTDAGGAYILLPRCHEEKKIYWNQSLVDDLYGLIADFISIHKDNIDVTRIAISGSSAGGAMVWYMLDAYPEMFATAFPVASTTTPSADLVEKASATSIWMIASELDRAVNYKRSTLKIWKRVCELNDNPGNCRLTTFQEVLNPDGTPASDNHHLAKVITFDLHMLDGSNYADVVTIDGNGNTVDISGDNALIKWIAATHSEYDGNTDLQPKAKVDGFWVNFVSAFSNYILSIVRVFQILLGL